MTTMTEQQLEREAERMTRFAVEDNFLDRRAREELMDETLLGL